MSGWEHWSRVEPGRQRLIFRPVNHYIIHTMARLVRQHDGDMIRGYVWMGLAQSALATHAPAPSGAPRSVGVRALSRSLDLPYETVRRKLAGLEATGFCHRLDDGGIGADSEHLTGDFAKTSAMVELEAIRETVATFKAIGLQLPVLDPVKVNADPMMAVLALRHVFLLRGCEAGMRVYGTLLNAVVFMGLMLLNAAPITTDIELAWRYAGADTPPPDDARASASVGQLADLLALPRETVRRRIQDFLKLGWAEQRGDGYRVTIARMQMPEALAVGAVLAQRFLNMLDGVQQLGLDVGARSQLQA